MADCLVDGRPTADARLCGGCVDQLKSELRALIPRWEQHDDRRELIPGLLAELEVTLTRQARIGERNGPRATETPLPFHLKASIDLETVRGTLAVWAQAVAAQRGISVDATYDATALAKWMLRWAGEVAQHENAGELHAQILSTTLAARRTIDLAPDRRFLGPCDDCGSDLYIWTTPGRIPATVHCATEECSFTVRVDERRGYLLEKAYNQLLTAAEMSRAIGELVPGQTRPISANTISQWAARGLSTTEGRQTLTKYRHHPKDPTCQCIPPDPCRRPRFLVEEVIVFARQAMGAQDYTTKETA